MNIVKLKVSDLIPYINNPRNNENAVDKVASSIAEFGFKNPIVIDKNNVIINGHTRLLASKKLGLKEVPVIVADDLSEAQVKAFRIADNKVAEYSKWDYDLLNVELEQLEDLDFSMGDFGFIKFDDLEEITYNQSPTSLVMPSFYDEEDEEDEDQVEFNEGSKEVNTTVKTQGIIQYNIVFNDTEEQTIWFDFLRYIRIEYEGSTISERLIKHIKDVLLDEKH